METLVQMKKLSRFVEMLRTIASVTVKVTGNYLRKINTENKTS